MAKEISKLFVTLGLDDKEFGKTLDKVQKDLSKAGKMMAGIGVAITAALGLSVKAAEEDRQSQARLAAVLDNVGVAYDNVSESLNANMDATMKKTGMSDDAQRDALAELILVTGDYNRALSLLPTALDLAAAKQIDVSTAAQLLGKVAEGNFGTLARYGIVLKDGATAAEALAAIQEKVKGSAEKMASPFEVLKNTFSELQEKIGAQLLPVLKKMVDAITPVIDKIGKWIEDNPKLAGTLIKVAAAIGAVFAVVGPLLMILPAIAAGFTLMLGPVGWVILAVAGLTAAVVLLASKWSDKSKEMTKIAQEEAKKQAAALDGLAASGQKNIDDEMKRYNDAHDEKVRAYNEEYALKYGLLDDETNASIKALQDQIKAINDKAQAEKDTETEIKLSQAIALAATAEEKKAAWKELNDYLKEQSREAAIVALENEIVTAREGAITKKALLDEELKEGLARMETERLAYAQLQQDLLNILSVRIELEKRMLNETAGLTASGETPLLPPGQTPEPYVNPLNEWLKGLLKFHTGGIVPGSPGQEVPIMAQAGEIISQPGKSGGITNTFNLYGLVVREEADVRKIARQLYQMQQLRV
jgi:membrane protein implicated in regulation of membrane protease activity